MAFQNYDYFSVTGTTVTYPTRDGGSTATPGSSSAPAGSRVEIAGAFRTAGATAGLNFFHADGTTAYTLVADSGNATAMASGFRTCVVHDGLSISATLAGNSFVVFYRIVSNT